MSNGRNSEFLPPVIPMPPGDHIVVSDPFFEEFEPIRRPQQYEYFSNVSGIPQNTYSTTYPPVIAASSFSYTQPPSGVQSQNGVPSAAIGRLFLGDQSVIVQNSTSPTHPYIPPVFPCGLCRREILDNVQAVQCYLGCKFWFHRTCVGVSEETFQLLLKDPYAEWMCDPCFETKRDSIDDSQYKIINKNCYA